MTKSSRVNHFNTTAGLAVAYVVTAQLGLLLGFVPAWDVTLIWPPSAIAFVAMLLLGRRALPGLIIGALATSLITLPSELSPLKFGIVAVTIATASITAALAAALAFRRLFPGGPSKVSGLTFLKGTITVFLACSIAALCGMSSLTLSGIAPSSFFTTGVTLWWIRDFCGVMMFGPAAWVAIRRLRSRRKNIDRNPIAIALVVNSVFVATAIIAFVALWNSENKKIAQFLDRESQDAAREVTRVLEAAGRDVETIRAYFYASDDITQEEFRRYASAEFGDGKHNHAQAVGWAPRVSNPALWEQQYQKEFQTPVQLYEIDSNGQRSPVTQRANYFPIKFIYPQLGNQVAVGFDLASEQSRRTALERSRDTGDVSMVAPIVLVQATGTEPAILICAPVYRADIRVDTVAARRANLSGFASAVYRIQPMFTRSLAEHDANIDLHLFDQTLPGEARWYHTNPAPNRTREDAWELQPTLSTLQRNLHGTSAINFAGYTWLVVAKPGPGFVASKRTWRPWQTLVLIISLGMVCSAILLERTVAKARVASERDKTVQALLKAQSANDAKAFFMAAAGHDIKQPLLALGILTDTLLMTKPSALSMPILGRLRESITQMTEHFDALIDASRFEYVGFDSALSRFSLDQIAAQLDSEVSPLCSAKSLTWNLDIDNTQVFSDPQLLLRLLRNLLSNAIRHTDSGSISCSARIRGDVVEFRIEDTGTGISGHPIESTFAEFMQEEVAGVPSHDSGLGLTITAKIDEALNLELKISSQPGVGTEFRFQLPRIQQD